TLRRHETGQALHRSPNEREGGRGAQRKELLGAKPTRRGPEPRPATTGQNQRKHISLHRFHGRTLGRITTGGQYDSHASFGPVRWTSSAGPINWSKARAS